MKKIKLFISTMLATMALASGAHAYPAQLSDWNFDLTSFGMSSYDNVKSIQIGGTGTVRQYLGSDNQLSVGDSFTEFSNLFLMSFMDSSSFPGEIISTSSKVAILTANNLQGVVSYIDSTSGGFQYTFTPGTGDLKLQVADRAADNSLSNFLDVSSFTLLSPSTGVANPGFLNNVDANGTSDLFAAISGASNVWTTPSGYDFGNTGTALLHTTNTLLSSSGVLGAPGQYYIDANVSSAGGMTAAVPEPGTMVLLGAGLFGLAIFSRRKINK